MVTNLVIIHNNNIIIIIKNNDNNNSNNNTTTIINNNCNTPKITYIKLNILLIIIKIHQHTIIL